MSSKNKSSNERIMDKLNTIKVLIAHRDFMEKRYRANHVRPVIMELDTYNVSFEQLRHESSRELICRYIASSDKNLDQSHLKELVKYKGLIDPEVIVWISAIEICQVFGLQLKDLSNYAKTRQLAMLELEGLKYFNWNEVKNLTGSV